MQIDIFRKSLILFCILGLFFLPSSSLAERILPLFLPAIIGAGKEAPPEGLCQVPVEGRAEDSSDADHVIGNGTPQSCTSAAVVSAVAKGGVITFNCGPQPVTITLDQTAKIVNNTGPKIVIDGGGKVTLSGGGARRILYMNTCDPDQTWTTSHCQDQDHPQLTIQNLTFIDGDSSSEQEYDGGGAVWVRGGRFKIVNCQFYRNVCTGTGPDVGGAAVREEVVLHDGIIRLSGGSVGNQGVKSDLPFGRLRFKTPSALPSNDAVLEAKVKAVQIRFLQENGIRDSLQIQSTASFVFKTKAVWPDLDGDGMVAFSDFLIFIAAFRQNETTPGWFVELPSKPFPYTPYRRFDIDGDGQVGFFDFVTYAQDFKNAQK